MLTINCSNMDFYSIPNELYLCHKSLNEYYYIWEENVAILPEMPKMTLHQR